MPLYVRDDEVKKLADEVAAMRRCSLTKAVREALELQLRQLRDDKDERRRQINEIVRSVQALPLLDPHFTDKDLYDDNGDPIL